MSDLIISLTTIHSRIDAIHNVIASILSQECSVSFEVRLYLSKEPYLLDQGVQDVPEELRKLSENSRGKFKLIYTSNIGPYRKFLPLMKGYYEGKENFSRFVTVDDDTLYPQGWLQRLLDENDKFECVVAYRGRQLDCTSSSILPYKKWLHSCSEVLTPDLRTVGTGKDGIIYRPEYFHPDVIDIESALSVCNHADDLWLKTHTAVNGVKSVLLSESLTEAFEDLGSDDENTLYKKINKYGGNDKAMKNLQSYFMKRYELNILDVFSENLSLNSTWINPTFLRSYFN